VKSNAVLLSHDDVTPGSGDLRVTLNKSAAAKDAGFTFQDAFSTRALFGLLANDDFTFKVTPDGSNYFAGLRTHKNLHGRVSNKDAVRKAWAEWMPQPGAAAITTNGLSIVGTVALTLALVWAWRRHGERSKAYAAVLKGELETDFGSLMGKIREIAR
jgi:hypothetical protein